MATDMSTEGTERQHAEAAQGESEERFQAIFSQAAVGIAQTGLDGKWLLVNNRFCEMLGYSESELLRKAWQDITYPDDLEEAVAGRRQLLAGEITSHTMEKRYIRKDGTVWWGRLYRSLVRDRDNQPKYIIAVVEDITEKKEAERALLDSELLLVLAQKAAHLGVWDRDLRTNEVVVSGDCKKLYGLTSDDPPLTYERWLALIHPEDRGRVLELLVRDTFERAHVLDGEFRVVWPDGSVHWLLAKGALFFDDFGRAVRATGVNLDITDRKQAEAALRESEARFRNIADTAPVGIWETGPDGAVSFYNKNALTFVGRTMEQIAGSTWNELIHPDDRESVRSTFSSALADRKRCDFDCRIRRADGEYRWVLCNGIPRFDASNAFCGYIGSFIDSTDLKRSHEEALSHQNLESMGRLASGIAHDFNNLLGGILASAELALEERGDSSPGDEELKRIRVASIRGAEIVRQLMIFGGQESARFEPVDASLLVREMLELLKVSISKHAVLQAELAQDVAAVQANPAQLRQVVMNLVTNASEEIGDHEGVIRVVLAQVRVGPDSHHVGALNQPEGDYVQIEVSDSGSGMSPEVQAKIFDPFFTSKFAGRGLGLAVVQGIIRAHGGTIAVRSAPGRGATFQVLLPCTSKSALETQRAIVSSGAEESNALAGTILVVEDEEFLRLAVSKLLRQKGCSVMEASDGSVAINLIRTHKDDIDMILLDVTIPGRSSREVFEEAQRMRPDLKIILTSAYGKETVDASYAGLRVEHFIRKPFHLDDLVVFLQGALAS
jgi:two-component system, cell cycle sensor histidine kinase and response regulator CckA